MGVPSDAPPNALRILLEGRRLRLRWRCKQRPSKPKSEYTFLMSATLTVLPEQARGARTTMRLAAIAS
jgi:hypothetical protein